MKRLLLSLSAVLMVMGVYAQDVTSTQMREKAKTKAIETRTNAKELKQMRQKENPVKTFEANRIERNFSLNRFENDLKPTTKTRKASKANNKRQDVFKKEHNLGRAITKKEIYKRKFEKMGRKAQPMDLLFTSREVTEYLCDLLITEGVLSMHDGTNYNDELKTVNTYDEATGELVNSTDYIMNAGQWVESDRILYAYDENGNMTLYQEEYYDIGTETWIGTNRYTYQFNEDNNMTERIYETYDASAETPAWIPDYKISIVWFDADYYSEWIWDDYIDGNWVPYEHDYLTYFESGLLHTEDWQFYNLDYDDTTEDWTTLNYWEYADNGPLTEIDWWTGEEYETNYGDLLEEIYEDYWSGVIYKNIFTYDDHHNLIDQLYYVTETVGGEWELYDHDIITWTEIDGEFYQMSVAWATDEAGEDIYYYIEVYKWLDDGDGYYYYVLAEFMEKYQDYETGEYYGGMRETYAYNDADLNTEFHWFYLDVEANEWKEEYKELYSYDSEGYLATEEYWYYDAHNTESWIGEYKAEYYLAVGTEFHDIYYSWNYENSDWMNYMRDRFDSDYAYQIYEEWNTETSEWQGYEQYIDMTNNDKYYTGYTNQYWDYENEVWVNNVRGTMEYDGDNRTLYKEEVWPVDAWVNSYQELSTYNSSDYLTEWLAQNWVDEAWVTYYKDTYTYDGDNLLELMYYSLDGTALVGYYKQIYDYDPDNYTDLYYFRAYEMQEDWVLVDGFTDIWKFNEAGDVIEDTYLAWDGYYQEWYNNYQDLYTYGDYRNVVLLESNTRDVADTKYLPYYKQTLVWQGLPPMDGDAEITHLLCGGAQDGAIDLMVEGGATPYAFVWSNGATTEDLADIAGGTYTVTVTDANGCVVISPEMLVEEPEVLEVVLSTVAATEGNANGTVNAAVSGGTPPYQYAWSNGSTGENLSNVSGAWYDVTVTDSNGCAYTVGASTTMTGIENAVNNQMLTFANPYSIGNPINATKLETGQTYRMQIISITGKKVFENEFVGGQIVTINTPIEHGLYLIRVNNGSQTVFSEKVVIRN